MKDSGNKYIADFLFGNYKHGAATWAALGTVMTIGSIVFTSGKTDLVTIVAMGAITTGYLSAFGAAIGYSKEKYLNPALDYISQENIYKRAKRRIISGSRAKEQGGD